MRNLPRDKEMNEYLLYFYGHSEPIYGYDLCSRCYRVLVDYVETLRNTPKGAR